MGTTEMRPRDLAGPPWVLCWAALTAQNNKTLSPFSHMMHRMGIAAVTDWSSRALARAGKLFKGGERANRDDEIAKLKSRVDEIAADNERLKAKIAKKHRFRIFAILLAILASTLWGYSCSEQHSPRQPVSSSDQGCRSRGGPGYRLPNGQCASWNDKQKLQAPIPAPIAAVPLVSTPEPAAPSSSHGCGSRGGPGYRLANGKCAGWHSVRRKVRKQ